MNKEPGTGACGMASPVFCSPSLGVNFPRARLEGLGTAAAGEPPRPPEPRHPAAGGSLGTCALSASYSQAEPLRAESSITSCPAAWPGSCPSEGWALGGALKRGAGRSCSRDRPAGAVVGPCRRSEVLNNPRGSRSRRSGPVAPRSSPSPPPGPGPRALPLPP